MTRPRNISLIIIWVLLGSLLAGSPMCSATDAPPLIIRLRDHVHTTDGVILIKHIATLEGPSQSDLKRWEELDLLDGIEEIPNETRITRSLVAARMLLAGCQIDRMTFTGATETHVERIDPLDQNDATIERLAQLAIARQLGLAPEQVDVRLLAPCIERLRPADKIFALGELDVIPPQPRMNPPRITVRWIEGGVIKSTLICNVQILVSRDWPVASRDLPVGQVLTADDVDTQPTWCQWTEVAPQPEQCVGRQLKRALVAHASFTPVDLAHPSPTSAQPQASPVIKPRDLVRVTVLRGNMTVVLPAAEALQAGRPGERIRLRNLDSQRVITGTVVAAGEVEIPLR